MNIKKREVVKIENIRVEKNKYILLEEVDLDRSFEKDVIDLCPNCLERISFGTEEGNLYCSLEIDT